MKLQQINNKTKQLAGKMKIKKGGGKFMDRMLKSARLFEEFTELIKGRSNHPKDESIMDKITKNRRRAEALSASDKDSNNPVKELAAIKAIYQQNIIAGHIYLLDKERKQVKEDRQLLKTEICHDHVMIARSLNFRIGVYQGALKELSTRRDKAGKELRTEISGLKTSCEKLAIEYGEYFNSTRHGGALVEVGALE